MQMAVPVSWQPGRIILAAMLAFLRSSKATNLSFDDASGSLSMFCSDYEDMKFENPESMVSCPFDSK